MAMLGSRGLLRKTLLLGHQSDGDNDGLRHKTALGAAASKKALPKCPPFFLYFFLKQMEVSVALFIYFS